jgi:hypothetical protein
MSPSVTETQIFTGLRAFVLAVTGLGGQFVLRAPVNAAAMPTGPFVLIGVTAQVPMATNVDAYTATTLSISRSTDWVGQIDCYGPNSGDMAQTLGTLFRSDWGCQQLEPYGVDPLYAGDAHMLPLVNGEDLYEERWTFEAHVAYSPVITLPQDTADALDVGLINVDRKYPPA